MEQCSEAGMETSLVTPDLPHMPDSFCPYYGCSPTYVNTFPSLLAVWAPGNVPVKDQDNLHESSKAQLRPNSVRLDQVATLKPRRKHRVVGQSHGPSFCPMGRGSPELS